MAESYAFRIEGIEPSHDPAWRQASESTRRAFWRAVVAYGLEAKDRELAAGLDRRGAKMVPIAKSTRENRRSAMGKADPNAPPLTPAYGLSRTRSLLDGRAHDGRAEFFWRFDSVTEQAWGRILGYHRKGSKRLPKRDVIGISSAAVARIKAKAWAWWRQTKQAGKPATVTTVKGAGRGNPAPKAKPEPKPKAKKPAMETPKPEPVKEPTSKPQPSRPNPEPTPKPQPQIQVGPGPTVIHVPAATPPPSAAPMVVPGAVTDVSRVTLWPGSNAAAIQQAIDEGRSTGFRIINPRVSRPKSPMSGPKSPKSPKPKP